MRGSAATIVRSACVAAFLMASGCAAKTATTPAQAAPSTATPTTTAAPPGTAPGDHHEGMDHDAMDHGMDHGTEAMLADDDMDLAMLRNGQHPEAEAPQEPLDAATAAVLEEQLALTRLLVERYPTIAAAEAAGYRRAGPFAPGLGTHYTGRFGMNADGRMDPEDLDRPTLIYDGIEPDAKLAGFMYQVYGQEAPEGFAGPNDHWHYHTNVCMVRSDDGIDTPLGADREVTKEQCDVFGGTLLAFTGYMVHVWTVPGYESPRGTFSEINPNIRCPDGTYKMVPIEELGTRKSLCRSAA